MEEQVYYASGKLLLFGEYLVLRGGKSLVMPLCYQQTLAIKKNSTTNIAWNCFEENRSWLHLEFSSGLEIIGASDRSEALVVQKILKLIEKEKPELKVAGKEFRFDLDFRKEYGFGTSSTFISLLGQWSGVDPYLLLEKSFDGSGFDVAAAMQKSLFIYQAEGAGHESVRHISPVNIQSTIAEKLLFIYTGKKQKSYDQLSTFSNVPTSKNQIAKMNAIVSAALGSNTIEDFEPQMDRSEELLSEILNYKPVKEKYFTDYPYSIKSLGAWGGDFIMATFRNEATARNYFSEKGMQPIFNYQQLIRK